MNRFGITNGFFHSKCIFMIIHVLPLLFIPVWACSQTMHNCLLEAEDPAFVISTPGEVEWFTTGNPWITTRGRHECIYFKWFPSLGIPEKDFGSLVVEFEGTSVTVIASRTYYTGGLLPIIDGIEYSPIDLYKWCPVGNFLSEEMLITRDLPFGKHHLELRPVFIDHAGEKPWDYVISEWDWLVISVDAIRTADYPLHEAWFEAQNPAGDPLHGVVFEVMLHGTVIQRYYSQYDGIVNTYALKPFTGYRVIAHCPGYQSMEKEIALTGLSSRFTFVFPYLETISEPIGIIRHPVLSSPVIQKTDTSFEIILKDTPPADYSAALWNARTGPRELLVTGNRVDGTNLVLSVTVPAGIEEELYDLVVYDGLKKVVDKSYHAVKVIQEYKNKYSFVHLTDIHTEPLGDYRGDTNTIFRAIIDELNVINPEFVIITGDIVGVGNPASYTYFRYLIKSLDIPVFIVPGNHEMIDSQPPDEALAFAEEKAVWEKYLGPLEMDFCYGNHLFIGLFTAIFRTDTNGFSLNPTQISHVEDLLNMHSSAPVKILFDHYPPQEFKYDADHRADWGAHDLETLYHDYDVNMELYGHGHGNDVRTLPGAPDTNLIMTPGIQKTNRMYYRLIRIDADTITGFTYDGDSKAAIPWNNLHTTYAASVDGTTYLAVIENGLKETFESALLKFRIPDSCTVLDIQNGTLKMISEFGGFRYIYVETTVNPESPHKVIVRTSPPVPLANDSNVICAILVMAGILIYRHSKTL